MKPYYNYLVDELGNIFNSRGTLLKQSLNRKGYPHVSLRVNKKPHTKTVHRIVAEVFIPNPNNLSDVDHIDGVRTNNCVTNLRWVSHGENIRHSYYLENRNAKGENNARAIISYTQAKEICLLLSLGYMPAAIRDMGYPYQVVRSIKQRKNWTEVSQPFNF